MIDDDDIGRERGNDPLDLRPHRARERDEHLLPEELVALEPAHVPGAIGERPPDVVGDLVVERKERRPGRQERANAPRVRRPRHLVAARYQRARDRHGGIHVPGERRNDEEEALHRTTSRKKSTISVRTCAVASHKTE